MRPIIAVFLILSACLAACGADDRREERLRAAGPNPSFDALMKVADANVGARKFGVCEGCHKSSKGAPDFGGPNLYGIFGQKMGQHSSRFGYTAALIDTGGRWDAPTLNAWIANPRKLVPGTSMQFAGVADPLDRADIIAYLRRQSD